MLRTRNIAIGIAGLGLAIGLATTVNAGSGTELAGGRSDRSGMHPGATIGFAQVHRRSATESFTINVKVSGLLGRQARCAHSRERLVRSAPTPRHPPVFGGAGGHYSPADGPRRTTR